MISYNRIWHLKYIFPAINLNSLGEILNQRFGIFSRGTLRAFFQLSYQDIADMTKFSFEKLQLLRSQRVSLNFNLKLEDGSLFIIIILDRKFLL